MREKAARIFCSISVRLSIWVAAVVAALFAGVLLIFSGHVKKAVKNEAMDMAEQTLMSAVEYTNNTLDKVETVARNMRWTVEHHLDRPDEMMGYCRTVLKYNEELKGCAVAFEPGYYKQKDECFMAYAYRTDEGSVTESNSYGNTPYMTQEWYASIKKEETSLWVEPMPDANNIDEAITSYSMPLHDEQGRFVGVFAIDVSLQWLSATVQQTKPLRRRHGCKFRPHSDPGAAGHALRRDGQQGSQYRRCGEPRALPSVQEHRLERGYGLS